MCPLIGANEKPWNSPTTLYIARRLQEISNGQTVRVLDLGCGDGTMIEQLLNYGYELYGYDLPSRSEQLRKRLLKVFGTSYHDHIRIADSERSIPFEDACFDIIYANSVFEHVRFLDNIVSECARVLKPTGVLLTNFMLANGIVGDHIHAPFAHFMPRGRMRVRYLQLSYGLGLFPKRRGKSALESAVIQDNYMQEHCHYYFMGDVVATANTYFRSCQTETGDLIRAKLDMMAINEKATSRWAAGFLHKFEGRIVNYLATYLRCAAFIMKNPV